MGFVETGINWWKLASKDRLQERTSGWFNEIHINNAFNIHHKSKQIKQQGESPHGMGMKPLTVLTNQDEILLDWEDGHGVLTKEKTTRYSES